MSSLAACTPKVGYKCLREGIVSELLGDSEGLAIQTVQIRLQNLDLLEERQKLVGVVSYQFGFGQQCLHFNGLRV